MKRVLLEAVLVALVGAAVAFAANAFSPRGLILSRNYFPALETNSAAPAVARTTNAAGPAAVSALDQLRARLQAQGLQLADSNQVIQLFRDPRREQDRILFVDARDQEHYEAGHIPGALLLDYYHMEPHLGEVLQACLAAEQIVVYCNGGECEDSELAAVVLRNASVPKEKLYVYAGGMAHWTNAALPTELGGRHSGQFAPGKGQ